MREAGGNGHASHPPAPVQHEEDVQRHIEEVAADLHEKRGPYAGKPHKPAQHDVIHQHQRRAPYENGIVGVGYSPAGGIQFQQKHGGPEDGRMHAEDEQPQAQRHEHRLPESTRKGMWGLIRRFGGGLSAEAR